MDNTFFHDKQLEEQLNEAIILPPAVEKQMHQAYDQIASGAVKQKRKHKALFRTVASLAACVAVVGTIGVVNPAFAAQLPFVGSIFEYWSQQEQQALEQSGHTKKGPDIFGKPEEATTVSEKPDANNGFELSVSEVYSNGYSISVGLCMTVTNEEFADARAVEAEGFTITADGYEVIPKYSFIFDRVEGTNTYVCRADLFSLPFLEAHMENMPEQLAFQLTLRDIHSCLPSNAWMTEQITEEVDEAARQHQAKGSWSIETEVPISFGEHKTYEVNQTNNNATLNRVVTIDDILLAYITVPEENMEHIMPLAGDNLGNNLTLISASVFPGSINGFWCNLSPDATSLTIQLFDKGYIDENGEEHVLDNPIIAEFTVDLTQP